MEILTDSIVDALESLGVGVRREIDHSGEVGLVAAIPSTLGTMPIGVEVRYRSQPLGPAEAARWITSRGDSAILALASIPKERGTQYRALGINYIDSGGNASLNFPGFRVHVEGRKPLFAMSEITAQPPSSNPAALKVIFVLLVAPGTAALSHERLATLATVSKGTVTNTLADLRKQGHVFGERGTRVMIDEGRLARDWVDGYIRDLRPRLRELELKGPDPDWWNRHWTNSSTGTLGGSSALVRLGAELRQERTVVFGQPPWQEIRREARLSRNGDAPVTLRERFWSAEFLADERFVPPLLAYADALAGGDPRETDAARELAVRNRWAFA